MPVVVSSTRIWIDSILLPRGIIWDGVVVGLSKEISCVLVVGFVVVSCCCEDPKETSCLLVVNFFLSALSAAAVARENRRASAPKAQPK